MTHLISSMALLLTPGTRKRLPQSGFVQTGFAEIGSKLRFRYHQLPALLASQV